MLTMRCGCLRWVERFGARLAAVSVKTLVFFWKLAQIDIVDHTGSQAAM